MSLPSSRIKKRILKERGIQLAKHSKKILTHDELPSVFRKTNLMRLIELKFHNTLDKLIFTGSIYAVGKRLGVDASTVSKWRKIISEAKEKKFWKQFPEQIKEQGNDRLDTRTA